MSRQDVVRTRVSPEERAEIEAVCKEAGCSISTLLKASVNMYRIAVKAGYRIADDAFANAERQKSVKHVDPKGDPAT